MKLCAISPLRSAPPRVVLSFLEKNNADFILLPGALENTPTPRQVQRVIKQGVSVFVEGRGGKTKAIPNLVTKSSITPMPPQIFWHHPTAENVDDLIEALPHRTFPIGDRKITFFICGELIAFNPDGTVKHNRKINFDIIASPSHTLMGHWNHLGKKFETLSRQSVALYATNNDREHGDLSTDVRIYVEGKNACRRFTTESLAWSQCEI